MIRPTYEISIDGEGRRAVRRYEADDLLPEGVFIGIFGDDESVVITRSFVEYYYRLFNKDRLVADGTVKLFPAGAAKEV